MSAKRKNVRMPPALIAELERILNDAYSPPNQNDMDKACKQIDRWRKETQKKCGELNVAVHLIRDARDP